MAARALGPEQRGVLAGLLVVATMSGVLGHLGWGQALPVLARRLPVPPGALLLLCAAAATVGFGAGWALGPLLGELSQGTHWALASLGAALGLQTFVLAASQQQPSLKLHNSSRLWPSVAALVAYVALWASEQASPLTLIASQAACVGVVALWVSWQMVDIYRGSANSTGTALRDSRSWLMSGGFLLMAVAGTACNNIDKFYFLAFPDAVEFGLYAVAYGTSRLLMMAQSSVGTALFAAYAGDRRDTNIAAAVLRALVLTMPPLFFVAAIVAYFSEDFLVFAYGPEFGAASAAFALLSLESVFAGSAWLLAQYFSATGRPWVNLTRQLLSLVPFAVVVAVVEIDRPSILLAVAMLASAIFRFALTLVWVLKNANSRPDDHLHKQGVAIDED